LYTEASVKKALAKLRAELPAIAAPVTAAPPVGTGYVPQRPAGGQAPPPGKPDVAGEHINKRYKAPGAA